MTNKEYELLTTRLHKISNYYMLPKLHKNEVLNEILKNSSSEYLQIKLSTGIEGHPINSGPVYHTSDISKTIHQILLSCLAKIDHILKDLNLTLSVELMVHVMIQIQLSLHGILNL